MSLFYSSPYRGSTYIPRPDPQYSWTCHCGESYSAQGPGAHGEVSRFRERHEANHWREERQRDMSPEEKRADNKREADHAMQALEMQMEMYRER